MKKQRQSSAAGSSPQLITLLAAAATKPWMIAAQPGVRGPGSRDPTTATTTVDDSTTSSSAAEPATIQGTTSGAIPDNIPGPKHVAIGKEHTHKRAWEDLVNTAAVIAISDHKGHKRQSYEGDPYYFTLSPTISPSAAPSASPTLHPTGTPTRRPTVPRLHECQIRMYYEKSWCWHDDAMNPNCNLQFNVCMEKLIGTDRLAMTPCNESPTTWVIMGETVRPKYDTSLCWTRFGDTGMQLHPCIESEGDSRRWIDQRFTGVCLDVPASIRPFADQGWCLTSGHEPRPNELLKFDVCDKVDNSNTHLWEEFR